MLRAGVVCVSVKGFSRASRHTSTLWHLSSIELSIEFLIESSLGLSLINRGAEDTRQEGQGLKPYYGRLINETAWEFFVKTK